MDMYLVRRRTGEGHIRAAVTVDDILVLATTESLKEQFGNFNQRKYAIKWLRRTHKFVGCSVS